MARKKKPAARPVTAAHKKQFRRHIENAEKMLKTLDASVKLLKKTAKSGTYFAK
jgi:hypothetical protein